ncbi:hypothetical protein ACWDV7_11290 [Streptomyces sp. NPDC003362]
MGALAAGAAAGLPDLVEVLRPVRPRRGGRAGLLPRADRGCGNFLLTSAEVRRTLPAVERALTFTPEARAAAEDQDWLDHGDDEESVPDGPLRMWRQAAADGRGLCGASVVIY